MNREHIEQLIHRSLDGVLSGPDREELARALREDPLLFAEVEELKATHLALASMFRQVALPKDFSGRVMGCIQPSHVPTDTKYGFGGLQKSRFSRPQFIRHRSVRLVHWAAAFAAAAIVILTVALVLEYQAPPEGVSTGSSQVGGRQGVPGSSEGNRTDSLNRQPEKRGASEPEMGTEASQPVPTPGRDVARQPAPPLEGSNTPPEVVSEDATVPNEIEKSSVPGDPPPAGVDSTPSPADREGVVEKAALPADDQPRETHSVPAPECAVLGRFNLFNGRAEVSQGDGKWQALKGDEELRQGAQVRTSVVGVASIVFSTGTLTIARSSSVTLTGPNQVKLDSGMAAVDKPLQADGDYLAVHCESYVYYVKNGAASIERRQRGLNVRHYVGFSTLTHETMGSLVFDRAATLDLEFGKNYPLCKFPATLPAPDWLARSRSASLWAEIEPRLAEKFTAREKRTLDQRLPRELDELMANALDRGAAHEFLSRALDNKKLDAACVIDMTRELRTQIADIRNSVPDNLAVHGARAAIKESTVDFATWREAFLGMARGDDGKRIVTETWRKVTSESGEPGRLRRVETPPIPPKQPHEEE